MKVYLKDYIKEIDELLESKKDINEEDIKKHLVKIEFFQHERLIHLLVTLIYAVLFVLFIRLGLENPLFNIIVLILMIFLLFYVAHYFRLENGVQYLYKQYDKMLEKKEK